MTKFGKIFLSLVVLLIIILGIYFLGRENPKKDNEEIIPEYVYENEILGKKEDLINFSVLPGSKVPNGILSYRGVIQGGWFFEGNILINILDANKVSILNSNGVAKTDWQTALPVEFEGNVDFTNLPKGQLYFEIRNDNPSDDRTLDKFIQIPITLE